MVSFPVHAYQKRIALLTYGSRGDVEPFVALGAGLIRAGHSVCLAAPAAFADFIQSHGIEFEPISGDPDQLARVFADQAGLNWLRMVKSMIDHVLPIARDAVKSIERASRKADLIVHSFLLIHAGHTIARDHGLPSVSAQLFPIFMPTKAFPAVAMPDLPLGGFYRQATHAINTAIIRNGSPLLYRSLFGPLPELPKLASWPFKKPVDKNVSILFAYSPQVLPKPDDWPGYAQVTGYWQLTPPKGWQPPEALVRFLEAGPPPVFFSPGSMRSEQSARLTELVLEAAKTCGQRLCLGTARDAGGSHLEDANVIIASGVPHAWLFPRMRHIFHHGGAGTTGAAATAGVPQTAFPFSADQAFWARRVHQLGLGPSAPPARRVTASGIEAVMREAVANPEYAHKAQALGVEIRKEDGVSTAVRIINSLLGIG